MERTYLEIVQAQWRTRRIGNTTAALKGLYFDRPFLLLVANHHQAHSLVMEHVAIENRRKRNGHWMIGNAIIITIGDIPSLWGYNMPLIVDHFAMDQLITQHTAAIHKWYRDQNIVKVKVIKKRS